LDDNHIFGQYGEAQFQLSSFDPFISSSDGGITWTSAGVDSCDLDSPPYQSVCFQNALVPVSKRAGVGAEERSRSYYALQGNGPFWSGPSVVGPPPWVNFTAGWRSTYALNQQQQHGKSSMVNMSLDDGGPVVFRGIPPGRAVHPACFPGLPLSFFSSVLNYFSKSRC
jgi:hypothetical protein